MRTTALSPVVTSFLTVSILLLLPSGCARSQELTKDQKLAKLAAEVLLDLDQKLLYSVRAGRLNAATSAAYSPVPKWKDTCPGLYGEEFRLETARMTDRGIIDAELIDSKLKLARVNLFPLAQEAKNNPQDAALTARIDKELLVAADQIISLGIALTRVSEETLTAFVRMEATGNACTPRELIKAQHQIEVARNAELVEILTKDLGRLRSVMANPRLAELLGSNTEYETRVTATRTRNPEAAEAKSKLLAAQKELETDELRRSRTALDNAIRKATR